MGGGRGGASAYRPAQVIEQKKAEDPFPKAPQPPNVEGESKEAQDKAAAEKARVLQRKRGYAATIATSPAGVLGPDPETTRGGLKKLGG